MIGPDRLMETARQALRNSSADQTEVVVHCNQGYLTRFAQNRIHQNVGVEDARVTVRAIKGKKIGVASANAIDPETLSRVMGQALEIAVRQKENGDFHSLPQPSGTAVSDIKTHFENTARFSANERAAAVKIIVGRAVKDGLQAAGAFTTEEEETAVVNSLGLEAYQKASRADLNTVMMSVSGGTGFAQSLAANADSIHPIELADEAAGKCASSGQPEELERGRYTVFLEPYAVGELLNFLAYLGFGATAYRERRSFLSGKLGQPITGPAITIWDDGLDGHGLPMPFDFEGVPKQKVVLIENGTARGVVYDSFEAHLAKTASTGHALPAGSTFGPIPMSLFLKTGDRAPEDLLRGVERGVYVTRFHYTNVVEPVSTTITGMTRDGTFLIKDGRLTQPVKNLRFTQNILEAFKNVRGISSRSRIVEGLAGVTVTPAMVIDNFNFSSETEF
jgi:predicted Zn-dependent protease